jgi:ankyrin repeat protein/nucleoside-triphosphatase THEP1
MDRAANHTCEWLIEHETFQTWLVTRGLLWIKGNPGSGKSTLIKHTVRNYEKVRPSEDLLVSFFFHGRGSELQKSPLGLFRSILYQLLKLVPNMLSGVVQAFKDESERRVEKVWQLSELVELFETSLAKILRKYVLRIFIDALDECGEEAAKKVVSNLQDILKSQNGFRLGICFCCRHYPNFTPEKKRFPEIYVQDENSRDIKRYIRQRLDDWPTADAHVGGEVQSRARGIFQWVVLVVDKVIDLAMKGKNAEAIIHAVQQVPLGLLDLYRVIFKSIQDDEKAATLRLFQWVCLAFRPLTLLEMRFAITIDLNSRPESRLGCQTTESYKEDSWIIERRIKALSCGLLEIVPRDELFPRSGKNQRTKYGDGEELRSYEDGIIVQFIHQSVKDFFLQEGGIQSLDTKFKLDDKAIGIIHHQLSRSCLLYISLVEGYSSWEQTQDSFEISSDDLPDGLLDGLLDDLPDEFVHVRCMENPLLKYAIEFGMQHARFAEAQGISNADLMYDLCQPSFNMIEKLVVVAWILGAPASASLGSTILHVAARQGLTSVMKAVLQVLGLCSKDNIEPVMKDNNDQKARLYVAEEEYNPMVKLLLENGQADLNSKDDNDRTPLSWAAENGREAIIKLLLATGQVEVDPKDKNGWTPLSWAAENGREAVIKLLLATGQVEVDPKEKNGWTPLSWAAENGHEAIVELLLATGQVEVHSRNREGQTPLMWALSNGNEAIVKLLCEYL